MIHKASLWISVLALAITLITGCTEINKGNLQKDLELIASKYIKAQYEGDYQTLISITSDSARADVENGALKIFEQHKLEKIISFTWLEQNDPNTQKIIVAVSAFEPGAAASSVYYEHLWFKRSGNDWYISKVERDA